jgi:TPR repeat protein
MKKFLIIISTALMLLNNIGYAQEIDELKIAINALKNEDFDAGFKPLDALARSGNLDAQLTLANFFDEQIPIPDEAVKYYSLAAAQGNVESMYMLGLHYNGFNDDFNGRDTRIAVDWFKKASALGDADAAFELYMLHLQGSVDDFVKANQNEALKWLELAAQRGHPDAIILQNKKYRVPRISRSLP